MATWDGSTIELLSAEGGGGLGVDNTVGTAPAQVLTRNTRSGRVYAEFETPVRRSSPPPPKRSRRVKFVESGGRSETLAQTQEVNLFNADRRGPARFTPEVEEEFGNVTPDFLDRSRASEGTNLSFLESEEDEAVFNRARVSLGNAQSSQDKAQEISSRMDTKIASRERFINKTNLEEVEAATPFNPTPHPLETTTFSTPFPNEFEATAFSTPLPDDTTSVASIASSSSGSTSAAVNVADMSAIEASGVPIESNVSALESSVLPVESSVSAIIEDPLLLATATGVGDISAPRNRSLPEDDPLFPNTEEDGIVKPKPAPRRFGSFDRHASPNVSEEENNGPRNQNKVSVRGRRLFQKGSTPNTTPEVSPIPKPAPRAPPRVRGILRNSTFADNSFSNTVIQDQENATIGHLGNSTTVNSENFRPPVNSTNAAEQSTLRAERSAARNATRAESSAAAEESVLAGGAGGGLGGILLPLLLFSSLSGDKRSSQPTYVPTYAPPTAYNVPPPPNVLRF